MTTLEERFSEETSLLSQLCGYSNQLLPLALNQIFQVTELRWNENIDRIKRLNGKVRYLFIGEAAPSTQENNHPVRYFYNTNDGAWCDPIKRAFLSNEEMSRPIDERLEKLAMRGFLLVDTMPFAENYSVKQRRNRIKYRRLVTKCLQSFMLPKLNDSKIPWAENVKVAFGVRRNARIVINSMPNGLALPNGQVVLVSEELIATTGAHYPGTTKIRSVFDLPPI